MRTDPRMILRHQDAQRLWDLLASSSTVRDPLGMAYLENELGRAQLVDDAELPEDVVTLHARVVFENMDDGKTREVTVVFPKDADAATGRISVLSPVGAALLGLRSGEEIQWPMPRGRVGHLRVVTVAQTDVRPPH
jgi:regulator of nucleoside diphosphate kinase